MNEFVKLDCACDTGYDKGALKKTIENNIFSIFGNINQNKTIVVRYHGILTENTENIPNEFYLAYFFNNDETNKTKIKLNKCCKCSGECYCGLIDLNSNTSLSFSFFDKNNNFELNGKNEIFKLEISPDPIDNIMQRYGFEQSVNLPSYTENKENIFVFKNIINNIRDFLYNLFHRTSTP